MTFKPWVVKNADGLYVFGCLRSTTRDPAEADLLPQVDAERLARGLNATERSGLWRAAPSFMATTDEPFTHIKTAAGLIYQRTAWTGGDPPPADFEADPIARDLVRAFWSEQVGDCLGLDLWECAGTTAAERSEIFHNRARYDAWRTLNPP